MRSIGGCVDLLAESPEEPAIRVRHHRKNFQYIPMRRLMVLNQLNLTHHSGTQPPNDGVTGQERAAGQRHAAGVTAIESAHTRSNAWLTPACLCGRNVLPRSTTRSELLNTTYRAPVAGPRSSTTGQRMPHGLSRPERSKQHRASQHAAPNTSVGIIPIPLRASTSSAIRP